MQLGAWHLRRCISRRAAQIESFFESRESPKHWGLQVPDTIQLRIEASLRDRLRWCGLQGLG